MHEFCIVRKRSSGFDCVMFGNIQKNTYVLQWIFGDWKMKKRIVYAVLATVLLVHATGLWAEQDEKSGGKQPEPKSNLPKKNTVTIPSNLSPKKPSSNSHSNPSSGNVYSGNAVAQPNYGSQALPTMKMPLDGNGGGFLNSVHTYGQANVQYGPNNLGVSGFPSYYANSLPMPAEAIERNNAFQTAITQLRASVTAEDKVSAREKLSTLVSEQLDGDLNRREEETAAIEKRIKEMRKQLDDRRAVKPEMLKILMMLIDNPQMGLGIPAEWMQSLMIQSNSYGTLNPTYGTPNFPGTGTMPDGRTGTLTYVQETVHTEDGKVETKYVPSYRMDNPSLPTTSY